MALPFLLVKKVVLVQVHPVESLENFAVIDFVLGELAIVVLIPFGESGGPGIEFEALGLITARRPGGHVNHRTGGDWSRNDYARQTVRPPKALTVRRVVRGQLQG